MRLTAILIALCAVTACATPRAYNRIDAEARPLIKSVDTLLIVTESEISIDIDTSNVGTAMGGGLIGALVDAGVNQSRTADAEELISPIRDKLISFDFGAQLEAALESELPALGIEGASNVTLFRAVTPKFDDERIAASKADAVLFVRPRLSIAPDFSAVRLITNTTVFPVNAALDPFMEKPNSNASEVRPTDNIYRNVISVVEVLSTQKGKDANAAVLSAMSAEELVAVVEKATEKAAAQIVADLAKDDDVSAK